MTHFVNWSAFAAAFIGGIVALTYLPWIVAFCVFSTVTLRTAAMFRFAFGVASVVAYAYLVHRGILGL